MCHEWKPAECRNVTNDICTIVQQHDIATKLKTQPGMQQYFGFIDHKLLVWVESGK